MKNIYNFFLIIAISQIILFCITEKSYTEEKKTNFKTREFSVGQSEQSLQGVNSSDGKASLEVWFNQFFKDKKFDIKIKVNIYQNIDLIINDLNNRKIDYVTLNSLEFCRIKEKSSIEGLMSGIQNGKIKKELVLVTNNEKIKTIKDLKNKKVIIDIGNLGDIPLVWLDTILLKEELPIHKYFFKSIKKVGKSSQAVMPLYFNQDVDACILTENAYNILCELNPKIAGKLYVLQHSPAFLPSIFCISKTADKEVRDKLLKMIDEINGNPKTKQGMALFKMDKIIPFEPEHIKSVEKLLLEYKNLAGGSEIFYNTDYR